MTSAMANPQPKISDPLLPDNDFSPDADAPAQPALRVVGEPKPDSLLAEPDLSVADDPLRAVKLMSEEEKIALCS